MFKYYAHILCNVHYLLQTIKTTIMDAIIKQLKHRKNILSEWLDEFPNAPEYGDYLAEYNRITESLKILDK